MSLMSYRAAPPRDKKCEGLLKIGGYLLSHILRCSTIGATVLNGRVRDGIECFTRAITTKFKKTQLINTLKTSDTFY